MAFGQMLNEIRRCKNIVRWPNEHRLIKSNDKEHMYDTEVIMLGLARWERDKFKNKIDFEKIAHLGVLHDVIEAYTGDFLSGIKKYSADMKRAVREVEEGVYKDKLEGLIPKSWREDYRQYILNPKAMGLEGQILAGADLISALFECIDELQLGNKRFKTKLLEVAHSLTEIDIQSVKYFLKYSLKDLGLPLDEYGLELNNYINKLEFEEVD